MNVRIFNAASMFYASPTGRQLQGAADIRAMARQVVHRLKAEIGDDEVGFGNLGADTDGLSREGVSGWFRNNILISNRLVNDLAATSLILVHEATHLVLSRPYIEEELWCRTMAVYYLNDLAFVPGTWSYAAYGGGRAMAPKLNAAAPPTAAIQDLVRQWSAFAASQLLDYILLMKEYSDSLTAGWIRDHFDIYGGIANRTNETKGLYIKVLAHAGGVANAGLVLQILRSVPSYASADWTAVVTAAGGLPAIRKGLAPLRRPGGGTAQDAQAIRGLETQWHVSL
jgi:hypothetical protein